MLVVAHAADWISTAVFLSPAVAVGLWVGVGRLRDRRRAARGPAGTGADAR